MASVARKQSTPRASVRRRAAQGTPTPRPKPKPQEELVLQLDDDDHEIFVAERLIGLPAVVAKAASLARLNIGKMMKSETNEYAGYKYVPIDTFYEKAIPIIEDAGLSIDVRETDCIVGPNFLLYRFDGVLGYKDGTQYKIGNVSIPHRFDGPQTAGSAHSYADKVLMRRFFKIATGEPDGDTQQQVGRGRAKRALAAEERREAELHKAYERDAGRPHPNAQTNTQTKVADNRVWPKIPDTPYNEYYDFTDYIWKANSVDELTELYRRAKPVISGFIQPDQAWIVDLFSKKKELLLG